ncbi:hypothetical protein ACIOKD_14375 [Streptomyces sp. NPDC087844]|uniref:hypothetical protein n=1 Tax=Streptomyces sp. NPDC087844 TaxID=3365805 RepID=UPI00380A7DFD
MTDRLHAVTIEIDICDLETSGEIDEIRDRIEDAVAAWKPTVTVTPRDYPAA